MTAVKERYFITYFVFLRRVYIERDDDQTLKLYIKESVNEDAATYICRGEIEGNPKEDEIERDLYRTSNAQLPRLGPLLKSKRGLILSSCILLWKFCRGYHIY